MWTRIFNERGKAFCGLLRLGERRKAESKGEEKTRGKDMSFQVNKGPKNLEALSRSRALPGGRELAVQERAGITG